MIDDGWMEGVEPEMGGTERKTDKRGRLSFTFLCMERSYTLRGTTLDDVECGRRNWSVELDD